MALVVFLKGINVGGHRRLRPSSLAADLNHFGVMSIGATGTFIVRKAVARATIRAEIMSRVPFEAEAMICNGSEILQLINHDPFGNYPTTQAIIPFVGVMARRKRLSPALPLALPASGDWFVKILQCNDRFILGLHLRQMKAITYLSQLEKIFGLPATIRSWSTILSIGKVLQG